MKKILLAVILLISSNCFSQDVIMQNGTVSVCSGTFYDSGGSVSDYSSDENYIMTICPEELDQRTKLDFQMFSTQFDIDVMVIYDGDDTSSPILGSYSGVFSPEVIVATFDNPTGCLTIEFISNNVGNTVGWAANISCTMPCQDIVAQIDSTVPMANSEGVVEVCIGDSINLNGSGVFEVDGTGASYLWDLGDGTIASGQSVSVSYDTPGVYLVNLDVTDNNTDNTIQGCSSVNSSNLMIRVSGIPDFTGTQASDATLCFGESTVIEGVVNPLVLVYNCPPPESGITALPDGSGQAYETSITVTCFNDSDTLTDVNQINSVCLNMEHSYSGDLDIFIISPNGQIAQLFNQGGAGTYFGGANNYDNQGPGEGADYCFSSSGLVLLSDASTTIAGSNPPSYSWMPGTYLPIDDFSSLLGSPLNGDWTIRVVDNLSIDDGYIFSWEINFDDNLQLQDYVYVSSIVSQSWDSDSSITEINGNTITIAPDTDGEFCYTFRTVDAFGCEYTKEVCVNVMEDGMPPVTFYEDIDGDGYGDPNSYILDCSTTPPFGYVVNGLDCNDTDNLVNPVAADSEGNGVDENCDGVDGNALNIEEVNLNDLKISPNPFSSNVLVNVPSFLIGKNVDVTINDLNGRLILEKTFANSRNQISITNLNKLEKAAYFITIAEESIGFKVVKKLIKL